MTNDHHHHHHHHHGHGHWGQEVTAAFAIGAGLNAAFVLIEVACGLLSGSLALLADAGHNVSDVLGLLVAWGASYLARRRPTERRTYGLGRTSILAALTNGILLLIAVGAIAWEAISRLSHAGPVASGTVIVVAGIGVLVNTLTALLFMSGSKLDLNVRGAYLHMAADAAVSLGVVVGGILISFTAAYWIDPAISLMIAAVIAYSTWDLLWQAVEMAVDSVPRGIDPEAVRSYLTGLPGVAAVHDLHIWGLSTTHTALTVHLVRPDARIDDDWLHDVMHELHHRFGIAHSTIQVESGRGQQSCQLAPDDVL
jgi:cobalt-zinc-cadmium efflux system protein